MNASRPARDACRRQALGRLAAWLAWAALGTGLPAAPARAARAVASSSAAPALPPEVDAAGGLRLLGAQRFRYWGWHVYDAQLYTGAGFDAARPLTQRLALSLTYARAFRASDIAERSLQEMGHQAPLDEAQQRRWKASLQQVLVDVAPGDRLTGIHEPARQARASFFHNGRPTGDLNDAMLAERFFGIWLSPQTSQPAMRRMLLGLGQDDNAMGVAR